MARPVKKTQRVRRPVQDRLPPNVRFRDPAEMPKMELREIRLTGKLVDLLPLRYSDIEDIEEAASEATIFQWFIDGWIILKVGVAAYVHKLITEANEKGDGLPFSVYHRGLRKIIGVTRVYDVKRSDHALSVATWYSLDFHGTGVNTEAKFLLLQYAFESMNCRRVQFDIDVRNKPSIGAVQSIGAKFEGKHESNIRLASGRQRTSVIYAITQKTWPAAKSKMERKLQAIYKELQKEQKQ